jgi:hypothetical protein
MQVSYASTTNSSAVRKRFNSLLFSITLLFIFIAAQTNAQTNYRSAGPGNWNNQNIWQMEFPAGSGNWIGALSPPNNPNDTVLIRNLHTVTIDIPSITIRRLVVGEGGTCTLQFDNANRTLNIGSGGVTVNAGATFQFGNANQTLNVNGGSVQVNAGGTFQVTSAAPSTTHTPNNRKELKKNNKKINKKQNQKKRRNKKK